MKIILRLLTFVRKRWGGLTLGFVCITLSTVGGLVIPRLLGMGIDTALRIVETGLQVSIGLPSG